MQRDAPREIVTCAVFSCLKVIHDRAGSKIEGVYC